MEYGAAGVKILAQAELTVSATHDADIAIYTVPTVSDDRFATRQPVRSVVSSIVVCCTGTTGDFSIRVNKNGEADADKQYIYYDETVSPGTSQVLTFGEGTLAGLSLESGDIIKATIDAGNASISIFGREFTR